MIKRPEGSHVDVNHHFPIPGPPDEGKEDVKVINRPEGGYFDFHHHVHKPNLPEEGSEEHPLLSGNQIEPAKVGQVTIARHRLNA